MRHYKNTSPSSQAHPPKGSNTKRLIHILLQYLWPPKPAPRLLFIISIVLLFLSKIASVASPLFYKKIVNALDQENNALILIPIMWIVAYGGARIMNSGFNELKDMLFAKVEQQAIRAIALKVWSHLNTLSLRFHLDKKMGSLGRIIERGTKAIESLLKFSTFSILPIILEISFVTIVLVVLYPPLYCFLILGTIALYAAYTLLTTEWRAKYLRAMQKADNSVSSLAMESMLHYETIKYFGNEDYELQRFNTSLKQYEKAAVMNKWGLAILNFGQAVIVAIGLIAVTWISSQAIQNTTLTLGDFVLLNSYLIQLYMPLNMLGFAYREIKRALLEMEDLFGLLDVHPDIQDSPHAPDLATQAGTLTFSHVSFAYTPDRPLLKDISFCVPAGKKTAIVGPSGAGKSTIARLLFRFYEPTAGTITIDDQDITKVTQHSLRKAIGIVPQDMILFNDTIAYNIAYGCPGASLGAIQEAARMANLHDFIASLPQGYDTPVGERGLKLSGGEKQRVAIARTLLKNPCIYLFDEATSALDTHTEKEIQAELNTLSSQHTTLVIAHRLSTIIDADEILVLNKGRIEERGTHADLLKQKGLYADLWNKQHQNKASDKRDAKEDLTPPSFTLS